jgi:tRNA (guanine-N7-)-methyltransferase
VIPPDTQDVRVPPPLLEVLPGQVEGPLRFEEIFGRPGPVEIEIGIGKGRFVLNEAERRPEVNFLGLEWSLKHLRIARDRAARRGLTNVRLHRADARHVVSDLVRDATVARVHVYCPDPWPKKRHHKRRLFSPVTVRHLERILDAGGYLNVSTDVREYFEEIVGLVAAHTRLARASDPLCQNEGGGRTNYEAKYLAAGRTVHRATWRKQERTAEGSA